MTDDVIEIDELIDLMLQNEESYEHYAPMYLHATTQDENG